MEKTKTYWFVSNSGSHYARDPKTGKLKEYGPGDRIELTEKQAAALKNKVKPVEAAPEPKEPELTEEQKRVIEELKQKQAEEDKKAAEAKLAEEKKAEELKQQAEKDKLAAAEKDKADKDKKPLGQGSSR